MLEIVSALEQGYMLSLDRLDEAMQQFGVHEIVCEGQPFDPGMMRVVDVEETTEVPDGIVVEVYRAGSVVLHPAQVKVARAPMKTSNQQEVRLR
jgi:molecular chaperone GrpE (heat shock protein)